MIAVHCKMCGGELDHPGGLLFAPPVGDVSLKIHLCRLCFGGVVDFIYEQRTRK